MSSVTIYGATNAAATRSFNVTANFPIKKVQAVLCLSQDQQALRQNDDLSMYRIESNLLGAFPVLGFVRCSGAPTVVDLELSQPLAGINGQFDLRVIGDDGALLSLATYYVGVTLVFYPLNK